MMLASDCAARQGRDMAHETQYARSEIVLYDYFRSSAAYRVRIVLNLKRLAYRSVPTSLLDGANKGDAYVARNRQGFVPMLSVDGSDITQSLAIIDWLDAKYPDPPMLPTDADARAPVLAAALVIACDIHPLDNLRVLKYLKTDLGHDQSAVDDWYRHWIVQGFDALENMAPAQGLFGGDTPNLADICLVPQMYNARRFDTPLDAYPRLVRIDAALQRIEAVAAAHPDRVKQ